MILNLEIRDELGFGFVFIGVLDNGVQSGLQVKTDIYAKFNLDIRFEYVLYSFKEHKINSLVI